MKILISTFSNSESLKVAYKEIKPDKLILLTSKEFSNKAKAFKIKNKTIIINPFNVIDVLEKIIHSVNISKDEIIINITEGTNAMASGALSAAFYLGIKAIYISNNSIIEIPIPHIGYQCQLNKTSKELLLKLAKITECNQTITQTQIASGTIPQRLTSPIRILHKYGLISKAKEEGRNLIILTQSGRILAEMLIKGI